MLRFFLQNEIMEDIIHLLEPKNISQRRNGAKLLRIFCDRVLCELCGSAREKNRSGLHRIMNRETDLPGFPALLSP
jgi:hypothetical protein